MQSSPDKIDHKNRQKHGQDPEKKGRPKLYLSLGGQKAGHELYRFVTLPRLCWYLLPLQRNRQD